MKKVVQSTSAPKNDAASAKSAGAAIAEADDALEVVMQQLANALGAVHDVRGTTEYAPEPEDFEPIFEALESARQHGKLVREAYLRDARRALGILDSEEAKTAH